MATTEHRTSSFIAPRLDEVGSNCTLGEHAVIPFVDLKIS